MKSQFQALCEGQHGGGNENARWIPLTNCGDDGKGTELGL